MLIMSIEFDRLEDVEDHHIGNAVICSFKTQSHGYVQVRRNGVKTKELSDEPSLYNFTDAERHYIDKMCIIVYRLVFDGLPPKEYR